MAMSKVNQREIDAFKGRATTEQWNDEAFLYKIAVRSKDEKPHLSLALIERILYLNPNDFNATQLKREIEGQHNAVIDETIAGKKPSVKIVENEELPDGVYDQKHESISSKLSAFFKRPIVTFLLLPWLLVLFYMAFVAAPRYESRVQLIVQQPDGMATMDASLAILSGLGMSTTNSDALLVKAYVHSNDMLDYLQGKLDLRSAYADYGLDRLNGLPVSSNSKEFIEYFHRMVIVEVDDKSQVITVSAQSFEPELSQAITRAIADRAEWYVNSIGHQLANAQLEFIQGEHELVESRLQQAKSKLLKFQQRYGLIDPQAEGIALSQIAYGLEAELAKAQAELLALSSTMSDSAPQVLIQKALIDSLDKQLEIERTRLSSSADVSSQVNEQNTLAVSEVMARFTDYKVDLELALQAYTASQVSLEKSRIEAYRQIKYLVAVESPTLPDTHAYPRFFYNAVLTAVILIMMFGIGKIFVATVKELG